MYLMDLPYYFILFLALPGTCCPPIKGVSVGLGCIGKSAASDMPILHTIHLLLFTFCCAFESYS